MTRITSKPIISALSDTGKIFVNDDQDVKQISKHDLMGQIANASAISYDGSGSGITASNVQGAITEVKDKIDNLASAYRPKGTVATYADLPTTAEVGWVYNVTNDETTGEKNKNYVWTDTGWDDIGGTYDMSVYYKKTEVDNAITSAVNTEKSARETAIANEATARDTAIADKELKSKAVSIPVASVVANTDDMSADYPYCYDYALTEITAETWADVYPTALADASVVDASLDGVNLTGAGTIRIYFLAVPTAVANVTIVYQKGVA